MYGPLHNKLAVNNYKNTIAEAVEQGGIIECGGREIDGPGFFVEPTIISNLPHNAEVIQKETFAPIVYVLKATSLDEAIEWNNEVKQGLSSAVFTNNLSSVFQVNTSFRILILIVNINLNFLNILSGLDQTALIAV